MKRSAFLAITAVCSFAAQLAVAAESDPLHSNACRDAISVLDAKEAEAAADAGRQAQGKRHLESLAALREFRLKAARACLGARLDAARPPPRAAAAAIASPPSLLQVRPPPSAAPAMPPVVTPRPEAPAMVTSCDAGGCWASDGTRLQRLGPGLLGPGGLCTVQGAVVQCP